MHLPLHRLAPDAVLDSTEREHLHGCVACRVEARLLAAVFDADTAGLPGVSEARDAMDAVRRQALQSLTTSIRSVPATLGTATATTEESPALPGITAGRFHRARWVGTGSLGPLFRVQTRPDGPAEALRVLTEATREDLDRIRAVIARCSATPHPLVVAPTALVQRGEHWNVTSPWVAGMDMEAWLALHQHAVWVRARPVLENLAAALAALHAAGVVHGHLHPRNVRVDRHGRGVLVDVGTWSDRGYGEVAFRAPEEGRTPEADWYAFGVLLCRSLPDPDHALFGLARSLTAARPADRPGPDDVAWALLASAPASTDARYLDRGWLGVGGMAEVHRVADPVLGRIVARKALRPDRATYDEAVQRFVAEAQVTAQLQHPGVVPVHDLGRLADGRPFFTMKEVRGRTLGALIEDAHREGVTRGLRRMVEVLRRVGETVAFAHDRGVIHRDLKPSNVMVGDYGEVLVLDWGLARLDAREHEGGVTATPTETRAGSVAGTPAYMAPEQARGEMGKVGPRTDVYALGAILYAILVGRPPYGGSTVPEVLDAVRDGPPPPPGGPPELVEACERAMAREPAARFGSAPAFTATLVAWLDGERAKDRALDAVHRAQALGPEIEALRTRAAELRARAGEALGAIATWAPEADKADAWGLEDDAVALELEAERRALDAEQALHTALTEAPDLPEAHAAMAHRHRAAHEAAEACRDPVATARSEALLRRHVARLPPGHADRIAHLSYLDGKGALTLVTDPPAEVTLHRYEVHNRRLVPVEVGPLGRTPLLALSLPMGSYLLKIRAEGRPAVRYPVWIGRLEHWDGVPPGGSEPLPIRLPESLGPDECYVPAGWTLAGGDPESRNAGPRRRLWCDGFVVQRYPITHAGYLAFLDALVAGGGEADALKHAPRAKGGAGGREGPLLLARRPDGTFVLSTDADGAPWLPDEPVIMVTWFAAMAYAEWLASATGRPWRLLDEWEWEKAARGVDGRFFPWGDGFDPSWCAMRHSHPVYPRTVAVTAFPVDESPYGVRGMGGNVRDWCANLRATEPPPDGTRPETSAAAGPEWFHHYRANRGGSWNAWTVRSANRWGLEPDDHTTFCGFRVARSL